MEQNVCTIPIRWMLGNLSHPHVFNTLNTNTHAHVAKERIIILLIALTLENKIFLAEQTTLEERNMSGSLTFTFLEWGLCLWGGAFSRILYFRIQTGTRTN